MADLTTPGSYGADPRRERWLLALGLVLVALGAIALLAIFTATLATVVVFGALLLLGGVAQLAQALGSRSEDLAWELAGGILYLVVGALLVVDPVSGAIGLTLLLALFFLLVGGLHVLLGLRLRRVLVGGGVFLGTGALELLLGLLTLLGWPGTGGWVIGLLLGIELVFAGGCVLVVHGFRRRASLASG